ncbi:OmpA family protein [Parasediminibacterium paludis]|uniref:OmpA family protein n=1 Tax=Parasediminibacterium paludis TaxID=908966 RepID=A0ABV8Q220_9BACT
MNYKLAITAVAISSATLFSCVGKKKVQEMQAQAAAKYDDLNKAYLKKESDLTACLEASKQKGQLADDLTAKNKQLQTEIDGLNKQVDYLKQNNNQVLGQLKDLSVITGAQAESIKKSMENIGMKDMYIQDLQSSIAKKDSLNMALVMNLKGAIGNLDDGDINIKVDKSAIFIDISDKLLFKSGSYDVTDKAKVVLGKVAKVLNAQPTIEFMVEGHTDNVTYKGTGELKDNWDLSVKRATTIVRLLQTSYGLDPKRMTAAGRSEYLPVTDNTTAEGRAANRRTRIVILPQLDQFFKLLEKK